MKKILIKIISGIASLAIMPWNCTAWNNQNIQQAYESAFYYRYLYTYNGLKVLTSEFAKYYPYYFTNTNQFKTISNMQKFLEDNYENFKLIFPNIVQEDLKARYNDFQTYDKKKSTKYICNFNIHMQKEIEEKIKQKFMISYPTHSILLTIAQVFEKKYNIKLDREAKRRKPALLKWYFDRWELIQQIPIIILIK